MSTATVSLVEISNQWRDARRMYPLFCRLDQQFDLGGGPCRELESPVNQSSPEVIQRVHDWYDRMDELVQVHHIRQLLQTTDIGTEENLRAMLRRQIAKKEKTAVVRDKVDYLLVQYYAHCAPENAHNSIIDHDDVAEVLEPVVGRFAPLRRGSCEELGVILQDLSSCACLGDLLQKNIIERARATKGSAGDDYFQSPVLVAYARFNFLLRRGFFRLMHADLHAIRYALHAMEARGQHACDCSPAGLGGTESFADIRQICHDWKKPFRAAYSVGHNFAQLVAIRSAVEAALKSPPVAAAELQPQAAVADVASPVISSPPAHQLSHIDEDFAPLLATVQSVDPGPPSQETSESAPESALDVLSDVPAMADYPPPMAAPSLDPPPLTAPFLDPPPAAAMPLEPPIAAPLPYPPAVTVQSEASATMDADDADLIDIEITSHRISELLIEEKNKGSLVTTIIYAGSKLVLASWEVKAFMRPDGPSATGFQRAIACRALLTVAVDAQKRGETRSLSASVALGHSEAAFLQESIAEAKDRNDVDTSVNLSATTKRLLAMLERAEAAEKESSPRRNA